jgi:hypothetical protein
MKRREPMSIFDRSIKVQVDWMDEGKFKVTGHLSDTYHEMKLNVEFSHPKLKILNIKGEFIRYPHRECLPALASLDKLIGLRFKRDFFGQIQELVGGAAGCAHLNNLLYEMGQSVVQGRFAKSDESIDELEATLPREKWTKLWLQMMPGMRNACIAWSDESPMVKEADKVELEDINILNPNDQ